MSLLPIPFQPVELRPAGQTDPLLPPCADCEPDPAPCLELALGDELVLQLRNTATGLGRLFDATVENEYANEDGAGGNITSLVNVTAGTTLTKTNPALAASADFKLSVLPMLTGRRYRVRVYITSFTAGEFWLEQDGQESEHWTTPGVFEWRFWATGVAQPLTLNWDAASDAVVDRVQPFDELGQFSGPAGWYHDATDYTDTARRFRHEPGTSSALVTYSPISPGGFGIYSNLLRRYAVRYRVYGRSRGSVTFDPNGSGALTITRSTNGVWTNYVAPDGYGIFQWTASSDFDGGVELLGIHELPEYPWIFLVNDAGKAVVSLSQWLERDRITTLDQLLLDDLKSELLPEGCYRVVAGEAQQLVGDSRFQFSGWTETDDAGTSTQVSTITQADLAHPFGMKLTGGWNGSLKNTANMVAGRLYRAIIWERPAVDEITGQPLAASGELRLLVDGVSQGTIQAAQGRQEFIFLGPLTGAVDLEFEDVSPCTNFVLERLEIFEEYPTYDLENLGAGTYVSQCLRLVAEAPCSSLVLRAVCAPAPDGTPSDAFGFLWTGTFSLNLRAHGQVLPRPFDGDQAEYFGASGTHRRTSARVEEVWQVALSAQGAPALRALAVMVRCEQLRVTATGSAEVLEGLGRQDDLAPAWPALTGHQRADVTFELVRRENAVRQLLRLQGG